MPILREKSPAERPSRVRGRAYVNGVSLYYELAGSGPPLVLIPSENSDRRVWDAQFRALARHYRVLRYDLRGYGRSAWAPSPYYHAHDLAAFLDYLGIARAALMGIQHGTHVAADLALERPAQVAALILATPGLGVSTRTVFPPSSEEMMARFMGELGRAAREPSRVLRMLKVLNTMRRAARIARSTPSKEWRHRLAGYRHIWIAMPNAPRMLMHVFQDHTRGRWLTPPPADRLGEIKAPTHIVIGKRINLMAGQMAVYEQHMIPDARLVVLPGAAVQPQMEEPGAFNSTVLNFLQEVHSPGYGPGER